jgi:predicted transcriptional regulator
MQEFPQLSADERDVLERVISGLSNDTANVHAIATAIGVRLVDVRCAMSRLLELGLVRRERDYFAFTGGKVSVAFENIVSQEV